MRVWRKFAVRSLLVATTALSAELVVTNTASADITVTQASAGAGRLTLRGKTNPYSVLTLDGGVASVKARASGAFDFGALSYIPGRCVVMITSPGQPSVVVNVANCAPISLKSRGNWNALDTYVTDELVFYNDSTWRAKQPVPSQIAPGPSRGSCWRRRMRMRVEVCNLIVAIRVSR